MIHFPIINDTPEATHEADLDLWGGLECTVNRVGNTYYDQTVKSGHQDRIQDLELIAGLGIRTLRYPALIWERIAADGLATADWRWADERLKHLRELEITPIVGFLHHGSGPRDTNLLDPAFPHKLAAYASAVIQRYPDLTLFTPVNEILTTARFSALYGYWYPHQRNARDFIYALLNQCHATVLAMDAVRQVNPAAKFISTEDIGKTYATPPLQYQADFDNERRWWSYDILCGRFNPEHPAWQFAEYAGIARSELKRHEELFARKDIAPDIMGINYYLTGERWLDHRLHLFPKHLHGGNGRDHYADTEAVRVPQGMQGISHILQEVWERYQRPLAITEAHLGSTADQQMRWFEEIWSGACQAKEHGVDVQAVTAWALFGLYNWNTLVTQDHGYYEPGVFDLSSGIPRATAYTQMLRDFIQSKGRAFSGKEREGWWQRAERILYQV